MKKTPVKQITNWAVSVEIRTVTRTFTACYFLATAFGSCFCFYAYARPKDASAGIMFSRGLSVCVCVLGSRHSPTYSQFSVRRMSPVPSALDSRTMFLLARRYASAGTIAGPELRIKTQSGLMLQQWRRVD